jgi:hypothetical protein
MFLSPRFASTALNASMRRKEIVLEMSYARLAADHEKSKFPIEISRGRDGGPSVHVSLLSRVTSYRLLNPDAQITGPVKDEAAELYVFG